MRPLMGALFPCRRESGLAHRIPACAGITERCHRPAGGCILDMWSRWLPFDFAIGAHYAAPTFLKNRVDGNFVCSPRSGRA